MTDLFRGRSKLMALVVTALCLSGTAGTAVANDTVALKHALYGAGYDIDNVNSTMDADTRAALKSFQSDRPDLQATGELNENTKKALGMVSVQVAAAQSPSTKPTQAEATAAPKDSAVDEDDVIEEDDDGGWSFF